MRIICWARVRHDHPVWCFCRGLCLHERRLPWACAVRDEGGELVLPAGWWVLPGAIMGGLLIAAVAIVVGT